MRIRVLGCGTSTGVPVPGCRCSVCRSNSPRNKRLRTSLFIELQAKDRTPPQSKPGDNTSPSASTVHGAAVSPDEIIARVIIDTGPDLRYQLLREDISEIDAALYTHTHADHIFGIDDLRGICFSQKHSVDGYASQASVEELRRYFPYIFSPDPSYMGGAPPNVQLSVVNPHTPFEIAGVSILPLRVFHGAMEIFGYRIGDLGYVTDCSQIPDESRRELRGLKLLFLSGLRPRPHPTHFSLEQAYREAADLKPEKTYLIHLSHDVDFERESGTIAEMGTRPVELAYDGLRAEL